MELKRLLLEGQEKQHVLEEDLGTAMRTMALMQEVVVSLIKEIVTMRESLNEDDEYDTMPPDFVLKSGERLEIN